MIWSDRLYLSENIKNKQKTYQYRVMHHILCPNLFLILIASNPANLLDIVEQKQMLQKAYPKSNFQVVGMAKGYGEAIDLVSQICDNVLAHEETLDMKSFFFEER